MQIVAIFQNSKMSSASDNASAKVASVETGKADTFLA